MAVPLDLPCRFEVRINTGVGVGVREKGENHVCYPELLGEYSGLPACGYCVAS